MNRSWKVLAIALLAMLMNVEVSHAQNFRWDWVATTTSGQGQAVPLLAIPGAGVTFFSCSGSSCSTLANTYNSSTSTSACPTSAQVVPALSASCVATADTQGNFGAWFQAGQYAYTLRIGNQSYGPYPFSVAGGGGGGGSGTVGAGTTGQIAQYPANGDAVQGATLSGDATIAPGGALTLATANTNPGTCGDATHVGQLTVNGKGQTTNCVPIAIAATGSGPTLQTNSANNASQTVLNLQGGTGVTVTNPSLGNVFISATSTGPNLVNGFGTQVATSGGNTSIVTPAWGTNMFQFGDSITWGAQIGAPGTVNLPANRCTQAYGALLASISGVLSPICSTSTGNPITVLAIPGDTSADIFSRQIALTAGTKASIANHTTFTLAIGTNDVAFGPGAGYQTIFETLTEAALAWVGTPAENTILPGQSGFVNNSGSNTNPFPNTVPTYGGTSSGLTITQTLLAANGNSTITQTTYGNPLYLFYIVGNTLTGSCTVTLDSVSQGTINSALATVSTNASGNSSVAMLRMPTLAGSHTTVISGCTGTTGILGQSTLPMLGFNNRPTIAVADVFPQNTSYSPVFSQATYAALRNGLSAGVQQLQGDGIDIRYVPTSVELNSANTALYAADGTGPGGANSDVHFSATGHAAVAQLFYSALVSSGGGGVSVSSLCPGGTNCTFTGTTTMTGPAAINGNLTIGTGFAGDLNLFLNGSHNWLIQASAAANQLAFGDLTTGLYSFLMQVGASGTGFIQQNGQSVLCWVSSVVNPGVSTCDTGLSQTGAATLALGSGGYGNASGTLILNTLEASVINSGSTALQVTSTDNVKLVAVGSDPTNAAIGVVNTSTGGLGWALESEGSAASGSIAPGDFVTSWTPTGSTTATRVYRINASLAQFFVPATIPAIVGPAVAPSGSCASSVGGQTVLSQDGHSTVCPVGGGTWTTKY